MLATEQGHLNTVAFVVTQMGADVMVLDEKGRNALHRAAALGFEECCVVILKADMSAVIQRDQHGLLPLHYAIMSGHANLIIMFFEYYENYLEMISNLSNNSATSSSEDKPQDQLLDFKGLSLLHYACFFGHHACIETICDLSESYSFLVDMLVSSECEELVSGFNKFSPIHCACLNNHVACVSYLLDKFNSKHSEFVELEDANGNRPIHICAVNNEYGCTSILLEVNCKLSPRNKLGQTPFMLAAAHNSFNIMELLFSDERPENSEDIIDLISRDLKGNSALHLALLNEHENCALFILDQIELNSDLINHQNAQGQTPLHLASSQGFLTCVEILMSKGADIWIKNKRQHTPLISCAKNNQVADCLELMLSRLILMSANQQTAGGSRANTTSNLMIMMMSGQKKTPPTALKKRLRLNQDQNSSHINTETFIASSDEGVQSSNLNSTELKQPDLDSIGSSSNIGSTDFKCKQINEQQNLNSTLIMNENVITSSGSSDENLNNLVPDLEVVDKENMLPLVSVVGKMKKCSEKQVQACNISDQLNLENIKPRSFSNSSSDSDFY